MRWRDVDYLCHGQLCTVIFDDLKQYIPVRKSYTGRIECATREVDPHLLREQTTERIKPPEHSLVIMRVDYANKDWG